MKKTAAVTILITGIIGSYPAFADMLRYNSAISLLLNRQAPFEEPIGPEPEATQWYMGLVAEDISRGLKTQDARLGELELTATPEKHNLKALEPYGASYIDIVFVDPDGVESGTYKSSFSAWDADTVKQWSFTVTTGEGQTDSELTISWHGLHVLRSYTDEQGRTRYTEYQSESNPLLKKMQVVDEETGEVLPVVSGEHLTAFHVNMNGQSSRTFRFERLTHPSTATPPDAETRLLKQLSPPKSTAPVFDLNKPPQIVQSK